MSSGESDPSVVSSTKAAPHEMLQRSALSAAWALIVALAGGVACGWCIDRYGTLGAFTLWPLGVGAGFVAARMKLSGRSCGWALVVACLAGFLVAETYWIRSNKVETWRDAVSYWPTFISKYEVPALVGLVFAAFGAESAFRQTRRHVAQRWTT